MEDHAYAFAGFRLDPRTRQLRREDGSRVALAGRAFDTLLCLVRARGRTVDKDELLARVWRGRVVEENNLAQAVSALRHALGEAASESRYVVTVPGRGYRFAAEVAALAATPGGDDPRAWRAYLAACDLVHAPDPVRLRRAIGAFRQVLDLDPGFARAWSGQAFVWRALTITGDLDPMEAFPLAKAAVSHALALRPDLAEAHVARGFNLFWHDWDWAGAEIALRLATDLDPQLADARFALAHLLNNLGRFDEALAEARRARELDPLSPLINTLEAGFLGAAGQHVEAQARIERALALAPDFWIALLARAGMAIAAGRFPDALRDLGRAATLTGGNTQTLALLGMVHAASGEPAHAETLLCELQARAQHGYVPASNLASLHIALGDRLGALAELERAYEQRDVRMAFLGVDARWNPLRSEPRFRVLARQLGLEQVEAQGRF